MQSCCGSVDNNSHTKHHKACMRPTSFIRRLGPHHFAHLRAVAEGISLVDSARRYLGIEHGHQAITAHQQTVDLVRSIARRQGNSAWRLIGVLLQTPAANDRRAVDSNACAAAGWSPRPAPLPHAPPRQTKRASAATRPRNSTPRRISAFATAPTPTSNPMRVVFRSGRASCSATRLAPCRKTRFQFSP